MSKQFLQKPRYEYYKGTTEVVDNELDNFVEDVVDRLNEQYFSKRELLRVKQNQDRQLADLEAKLAEKDKEIEQLTEELDYKNFWNDFIDLYNGNKLKTQMLHENCKDKISFAVEQLELARRRIDRLGYNENKCLNKKDCIEDCLEEIDNQIKELKGEE